VVKRTACDTFVRRPRCSARTDSSTNGQASESTRASHWPFWSQHRLEVTIWRGWIRLRCNREAEANESVRVSRYVSAPAREHNGCHPLHLVARLLSFDCWQPCLFRIAWLQTSVIAPKMQWWQKVVRNDMLQSVIWFLLPFTFSLWSHRLHMPFQVEAFTHGHWNRTKWSDLACDIYSSSKCWPGRCCQPDWSINKGWHLKKASWEDFTEPVLCSLYRTFRLCSPMWSAIAFV
jgi:hypothetical protein